MSLSVWKQVFIVELIKSPTLHLNVPYRSVTCISDCYDTNSHVGSSRWVEMFPVNCESRHTRAVWKWYALYFCLEMVCR